MNKNRLEAFSDGVIAIIITIMFYGFIMFLNGLGFLLLRKYVELDAKLTHYNKMYHRSNLTTVILYFCSVPLAWVSVYFSFAIFIRIPIWYFLPERLQR